MLKFKRWISLVCIALLLAGLFTGNYNSVQAEAGLKATTEEEFRGVWIAYSDFLASRTLGEDDFMDYVGRMFDNVAGLGMNAVMVHVRPFSDAMYDSMYYPWSYYASGQQGKDPGYDPLEIMVREAHERGLEIHAWLNPYRVTKDSTDLSKLSEDNPAKVWLASSKKSTRRNVLKYSGSYYYNPSKPAVRELIKNGITEIVSNYDVDGIHFDDYFYPALGSNYANLFDNVEYESYKKSKEEAGKTYMNIADWRRNNVNTLIKDVYAAIKRINPDCVFGISPGGYIDYLNEDTRWYVDYRTWMSKSGYIDYICPQLYWSFNTINTYPFYDVLMKWLDVKRRSSVKVYVGLPVYKLNGSYAIGTNSSYRDTEWYNPFILANMVTASRSTDSVSGFIFFDYQDLVAAKNEAAVDWLYNVW